MLFFPIHSMRRVRVGNESKNVFFDLFFNIKKRFVYLSQQKFFGIDRRLLDPEVGFFFCFLFQVFLTSRSSFQPMRRRKRKKILFWGCGEWKKFLQKLIGKEKEKFFLKTAVLSRI